MSVLTLPPRRQSTPDRGYSLDEEDSAKESALKVVELIRVSTSKQETSPQTQARDFDRWRDRHNAICVARFSDTESATTPKLDERPTLIKAVGPIRKHGQ